MTYLVNKCLKLTVPVLSVAEAGPLRLRCSTKSRITDVDDLSRDGYVKRPENKPNSKKRMHPRNPDETKNLFGRRSNFYSRMSPSYLNDIRYVAGISVSPFSVGWSQIDTHRFELLDYDGRNLETDSGIFLHKEQDVFKIARQIALSVPTSDLYVMEHFKLGRRTLEQSVLEIQLLSMLTAIFNKEDPGSDGKEKVHFQNKAVTDYLYELNLGGERISAGQKLQRMLSESKSTIKPTQDEIIVSVSNIRLTMDPGFMDDIFHSEPRKRDACALSLLIALSFVELNWNLAKQSENEHFV